eukprot:4014881-Alexandrium_andersonii.AAC.1
MAARDANALLLHLHGQVLRLIAGLTGAHYDGLGHAARSLRRVGGVSPRGATGWSWGCRSTSYGQHAAASSRRAA